MKASVIKHILNNNNKIHKRVRFIYIKSKIELKTDRERLRNQRGAYYLEARLKELRLLNVEQPCETFVITELEERRKEDKIKH